jgi:hypothetical protein
MTRDWLAGGALRAGSDAKEVTASLRQVHTRYTNGLACTSSAGTSPT